MNNNIAVIIIVTLLIGGGVGFFGGMQYQKNQRSTFSARGGSAFGRNNNARGGSGVTGDILSIDKNTMTVKLPNGSSKIVVLSSATTINKAAEGSVSDLVVGTQVAAFGSTNSDGSVTATNVQINPAMRGPGGPSGASGSAGY